MPVYFVTCRIVEGSSETTARAWKVECRVKTVASAGVDSQRGVLKRYMVFTLGMSPVSCILPFCGRLNAGGTRALSFGLAGFVCTSALVLVRVEFLSTTTL